MILLEKNPGLVQKQTNVQVEEENEYLLTRAIKKLVFNVQTFLNQIKIHKHSKKLKVELVKQGVVLHLHLLGPI